MAELKCHVVLQGIDIAEKVLLGVMESIEFANGFSDDFKQGFEAFGKAAINAFQKLRKEHPENLRMKKIIAELDNAMHELKRNPEYPDSYLEGVFDMYDMAYRIVERGFEE